MNSDGRPTGGPPEEPVPPTDEHSLATALQLPQFRNVRALLEGTFSTNSSHPSLVFCSLARCGSTFAGYVLHQLAERSGMTPFDLDGYVFNLPIRTPTDRMAAVLVDQGIKHSLAPPALQEQFAALIRPSGALYGPFRHSAVLNYLPALESLKILILLRDPRDALTSRYYWSAFGQNRRAFPNLRENVRQKNTKYDYSSVDTYVLSRSFDYLKEYKAYCAYLAANPNSTLTRYEDMIADFQGWLRIVRTILGLPLNRRALSQITKQVTLGAVAEDATAHKRQVIPGDHRRKLKPETIARLNELFHDEMEFLGYAADGRVVSPKCRSYRAPSRTWSHLIPTWLSKWATDASMAGREVG
jgi:hypothetical protein